MERHGGRTPGGVLARVLQRILALTIAIWHNDRSGQPINRSPLAYTTDPWIDHLAQTPAKPPTADKVSDSKGNWMPRWMRFGAQHEYTSSPTRNITNAAQS